MNTATAVKDKPFLSEVQELRQRARQPMEMGAVNQHPIPRTAKTVIRILNEVLATEIVCVLPV